MEKRIVGMDLFTKEESGDYSGKFEKRKSMGKIEVLLILFFFVFVCFCLFLFVFVFTTELHDALMLVH